MLDLYLPAEFKNPPLQQVPVYVGRCIDDLAAIQKKVNSAVDKAKKSKTASKKAKSITLHWWKIGDKAQAIEALQDAMMDVSDVQGDQAEAIQLMLDYQQNLSKVMQFLLQLGVANIAANRTVVREVEMRLKNASEEEISAMARQELCAVVAQLKAQLDLQERQERLLNDQKAVKAKVKGHEESIEDLREREEVQDRLLQEREDVDRQQNAELQRQAEKDVEHDQRINENREDIEVLQKGMEEQGRIIEEQALADRAQDDELKRQADKDREHDEKIAAHQKHLGESDRNIALIQKTLAKHRRDLDEAQETRGVSKVSRVLSLVSLIVSLAALVLAGYAATH